MTTIADHDAYIAAAPEPFRPSLKLLRALLARALPEAEEVVAYNMPGFRIGGPRVAKGRRGLTVYPVRKGHRQGLPTMM